MRFFERFKTRRGSDRVEPELAVNATEHVDVQASATESFEAATERYFARLASMGIPSPSDWRNPKKKPATTADVDRMYDVIGRDFSSLKPATVLVCWETLPRSSV